MVKHLDCPDCPFRHRALPIVCKVKATEMSTMTLCQSGDCRIPVCEIRYPKEGGSGPGTQYW